MTSNINQFTQLPRTQDVAKLLLEVGAMNSEQCTSAKNIALSLYVTLQDHIDPEAEEDDFDQDISMELKKLIKIQSLLGALVGLTAAISRRMKSLVYEAMTEEMVVAPPAASRTRKTLAVDTGIEIRAEVTPLEIKKKKKYTQADKEYAARGAVADLEGLENSLDIAARNIENRIFLLRNAVRARY